MRSDGEDGSHAAAAAGLGRGRDDAVRMEDAGKVPGSFLLRVCKWPDVPTEQSGRPGKEQPAGGRAAASTSFGAGGVLNQTPL